MTDKELRDLFSQHGVVTRASIARHQSGKSRGYAFVKFKLQSAADNAIMRLDKYEVSIM
jgi:RNA recognition motif-containing protein